MIICKKLCTVEMNEKKGFWGYTPYFFKAGCRHFYLRPLSVRAVVNLLHWFLVCMCLLSDFYKNKQSKYFSVKDCLGMREHI